MVYDQDASTHQIWDSHFKEYRRYKPNTKQDGWTEGQKDRWTVLGTLGGISREKTNYLLFYTNQER